jgi:hypothetical protein
MDNVVEKTFEFFLIQKELVNFKPVEIPLVYEILFVSTRDQNKTKLTLSLI